MRLRPRTPAQMDRLMRHLIAANRAYVAHRDHGVAGLSVMWGQRSSRLAAGYRALNGTQATHYTTD